MLRNGAAMLVREIEVWPGDVAGIPGDIHADKQDNAALRVVWNIFKAFRVNTGVLIGDTFDSIGVSRHPKLIRDYRWGRSTIKAEEKAIRPWLEELEAIVLSNRDENRPGGLHALTGNHEYWSRLMANDYPGLLDTPWVDYYGDLFDGWHVWDEATALKLGPLLVCHGHRLRGSLSQYSAASVLRNYPGQNTLYGHTHRIDSAVTPTFKYGKAVDHGAWTIGHLRDIKEELLTPALGAFAERHKQGAALVFFYSVEGELRFKIEQITVERSSNGTPYAVVGGVLFSV